MGDTTLVGDRVESFRCEELLKAFNGRQILAGLTIQFPSSGITAILGPNGAGKTTLLNVLTGFLQPDGGRCFLGDCETTRRTPLEIARLGVVRSFQNIRLAYQASVLDNVLVARPSPSGESLLGALFRLGVSIEDAQNRTHSIQLLHRVGLEANLGDTACELSYGIQKLLSLACCISTGAHLLLLDEPTAGLDPEMTTRIVGLLRALRDEGKVIVIVEHDINLVRILADQVIVLDGGIAVAQGRPEDVLDRPEILEAYVG